METARYRVNLKAVIEHGAPEERKRFIRDFVASIEVDGKERTIKIGFYVEGGNSPLRVVPPRSHSPKSEKWR